MPTLDHAFLRPLLIWLLFWLTLWVGVWIWLIQQDSHQFHREQMAHLDQLLAPALLSAHMEETTLPMDLKATNSLHRDLIAHALRLHPTLSFTFISETSDQPHSQARGKSAQLLGSLQQGQLPLGRQWWREERQFFLLRPLQAEGACLECHAKQGHPLAGAILWQGTSATPSVALLRIGLLMLGCLTMALSLFLLTRRLLFVGVKQPLKQATRALHDLRTGKKMEPDLAWRLKEWQNLGVEVERTARHTAAALHTLQQRHKTPPS